MLSRTADNLYWMARYIERAENVARVLDVTYNMSLVPGANGHDEKDVWVALLDAAGNPENYERDYGEVTAAGVIQYLSLDMNNPSSIYSTLRSARENARAVRVTMPTDTWEAINSLWLEFGQFTKRDLTKGGLTEFCDWVKSHSHLFRGVCFGTMLRDEAFSFLRLGTFIERADNTARLLNVKYDFLSVEEEQEGNVDYYEWSAVLRSISAFQAYQTIYSDAIDPVRVSELLVLRHDMPRSLHACYDEIVPIVESVAEKRQTEAKRLSGELHAKLHYGRIQDIHKFGLGKFLDDFIRSNYLLGEEIQRSFLSANY
ncbi:MAG: alpha-E domain-containing protein [Methylophilus sp.]|jgi:uncharacterized alpha-E superfamily protein